MRSCIPMVAPRLDDTTHILVVEDDLDIALLIRHAFEREGQPRVEMAATGQAALRAVDADPPDVIILDINLPDVDGFEVCRRIRARTERRDIRELHTHLPVDLTAVLRVRYS